MDPLPLSMPGTRPVYAGFWIRLAASLIDSVILVPLLLLIDFFQRASLTLSLATALPVAVLFMLYEVGFNAWYGGTIGKIVVGIRIARLDGSPIGWNEALLRSSVYIGFACIMQAANYDVLLHVDAAQYERMSLTEWVQYMQQNQPIWGMLADKMETAWFWSEFVVLLLNERKRAIHDFIAGTVVIYADFVRSPVDTDAVAPIDFSRAPYAG